jgi:hypothetical protein
MKTMIQEGGAMNERIQTRDTEYGRQVTWQCTRCGATVTLDFYTAENEIFVNGERSHFEFAAKMIGQQVCRDCLGDIIRDAARTGNLPKGWQ